MKIIIIGGGIAGMYTAYKLSNQHNIMLFESNSYLGGRIYTHYLNSLNEIQWEAGAGRFTKNMKLLIKLIKDLGLYKNLVPIPSNTTYLDSNLIKHNVQSPENSEIISEIFHNITSKCIEYIKNKYSKTKLQKYTLIQLFNKHFDTETTNLIIDSYGYYSELAVMNAYDAIRLYQDMNNQQFYILKGGLSQIIKELYYVISKYVSINLNSKLQTVIFNKQNISITINKKHYTCDKLVLAIPKNSITNIQFINQHIPKYLLNSISCQPLLRIYCVYPKINGTVWFENISKTTTNNILKYIIPIDKSKGVIMISYTDSIFTQIWIKHQEHIKTLIRLSLSEIFPNIQIPDPQIIKYHYWECGCGYWLTNQDSKKISHKMLQPIPNKNLYVCGENYSMQQAWIEGALSTADKISKML